MLSFNLQAIFTARGIDKPYTFLVKAGFSPHIATSIVTNSNKALKISHVELLCKVLVCEPNDLFSFTPNKNEVLPDEHPLLKLKHTDIDQNWRQTFATIPFKELKELTTRLTKKE